MRSGYILYTVNIIVGIVSLRVMCCFASSCPVSMKEHVLRVLARGLALRDSTRPCGAWAKAMVDSISRSMLGFMGPEMLEPKATK